ncbi:MAG TPA: decaprenyl-phosphate phosphoribosyltransferase [Candidatus Polarisedimenticolaceae bacterium]|nr:decaprenyl-phosphate phosphoribosyltransferase [Candidatus Polarisedimenticolaceae bacterium]
MPEPTRSPAAALLVALRPKQWVKNVFVFAPLVFADRLFDAHAVALALATFVTFCLLSSAVYLANDVRDREADRLHPVKCRRPIAAGELSPAVAIAASVVLDAMALAAAFVIAPRVGGVATAYLVLNILYSFGLKRVVILDVMIVASGFLLRAAAGAFALDVLISHWLVLCTGLLALFLGFVKRRQEIATLTDGLGTRAILREYSLPFLDEMIGVVTAATVVAYAFYAFDPKTAEKLHTEYMGLTIPFVLYGIFRTLYLVHQRGEGENPTGLFLSDRPLQVAVLSWGVSVVLLLYFRP